MTEFGKRYPGRTIEQEVALIRDTNKWPHWPVLPVKRRDLGGGAPEIGMINGTDLEMPTVRFKNIWDRHGRETREPIKYASVEAMVEDGWVGD